MHMAWTARLIAGGSCGQSSMMRESVLSFDVGQRQSAPPECRQYADTPFASALSAEAVVASENGDVPSIPAASTFHGVMPVGVTPCLFVPGVVGSVCLV